MFRFIALCQVSFCNMKMKSVFMGVKFEFRHFVAVFKRNFSGLILSSLVVPEGGGRCTSRLGLSRAVQP